MNNPVHSPLIAPSLLSANFCALGDDLDTLKSAGITRVHVDVMDGHFVPNLSFGLPILSAFPQNLGFFYDVHLMVKGPALDVEAYCKAGAHSLTFHIEAAENPKVLIQKIRQHNCQVGLSIKPDSHLASVRPYLKDIDTLLIMTVEPGFGGQIFREDQLSKIAQAHAYRTEKKLSFRISVDGGITAQTAYLCQQHGADTFVAGTAVFKGDIKKNLNILQHTLNGGTE